MNAALPKKATYIDAEPGIGNKRAGVSAVAAVGSLAAVKGNPVTCPALGNVGNVVCQGSSQQPEPLSAGYSLCGWKGMANQARGWRGSALGEYPEMQAEKRPRYEEAAPHRENNEGHAMRPLKRGHTKDSRSSPTRPL